MGATPTPIRQQYLGIKRQYPQAIVLFRLGDFYETFDEDARIVANELDIVLTSREMGKGNRVPMAGIPYHALENYLARLINHGHKVAICEQTTKPGESRGIVDREVVRVVTPGTVVEPGLLDSGANNYLAGVVTGDEEAGIAYVDITTGEFAATQMPLSRLVAELERLRPSEVIGGASEELRDLAPDLPLTPVDELRFELEAARRTLLEHFGTSTLDGFGLGGLPLATRAAGGVVRYLQETQRGSLAQLTRLSAYSTGSFMALDVQTQVNLEVFRNSAGSTGGSLLAAIDMTKTAMGSRLLKRWLGQPLLDIDELVKRQDAVEWFVGSPLPRNQVAALLGKISDLERVINRIGNGIANPHELVALRHSLERIPELREALGEGEEAGVIGWLVADLKPREDIVALISEAIADEPAAVPGEGGVIRPGFSEELDELRQASGDARQYLANLERFEQESTGIKSLRVGYNRVFGYYFEVSNANLSQVPETYIRKQTLANGERYYTPELKEYESRILNARERIGEVETDIYRRVCRQVATTGEQVLAVAGAIARLDVLSGLAQVAVRHGYVRPTLTNDDELIITQGRHPVVERALTDGSFVPNDVQLSNTDAQLIILTGPNMAGKSTYLRQVALIVLLAQMGSFVPAEAATIGLVDRIFTRIGARDDLAAGQSTFMLEMVETANILNNATPKSLLILDEIGRGTSTYDGLSIARAVAEYIHNHPRLGAKTLFATHYHEMVELAGFLPRVRNFNVAVAEDKGEVIFLRRIVPGGVDKSYGIHVAKLAGLPRSVVHRAQEVLDDLEADGRQPTPPRRSGRRPPEAHQLSLMGGRSPLAEELQKVDIDSMTPLEALTKLYELQQIAKEG
jgi:DNA mismatch repair protein MutS